MCSVQSFCGPQATQQLNPAIKKAGALALTNAGLFVKLVPGLTDFGSCPGRIGPAIQACPVAVVCFYQHYLCSNEATSGMGRED